uniref:Wu:fj29h11 n=1 Tax=Hippocampus comes TaxID=109280 RepID=A0A3Q2Y8U5_HIPCM
DLAEFMKYLADHYNCESPYELGIRIHSLGLPIALASLHSCPLLEDLNEWSQWELIFKPFHGSLKDFIERNAGRSNTGLAALEVAPSLLLRITSDTGDTYFSNAALTLDPVGTAGHLVSIVVADGITNAPTALLANHMQSSLAAAVAEEGTEEDMSCYTTVANFLLECLVRIPNRICQALLQQVFLEPLSRVLGQTKSKLVLITVAQSNPRHINCLHRLGILMGITEWLKDYQKKLTTSQIPNGSNVVDSESSSLSESAEEELFVEMSDNCSEAQAVCSNPSELLDLNEDELATSQPEPTLDVHRAIIEEIRSVVFFFFFTCLIQFPKSNPTICFTHFSFYDRKKEFGIGVELTSEGQNLIQAHQYRLGRSLDRLSTELYSKDTHFVLELIQNADDNNYPSGSDVVPALAFVVERDCITILNNETGFQEANIKAICDVGQSTKGKHKYGYIGQKGIGFKSVFKVTDRPEIHSNGFHLFFDKTCGPMGYILPHWMDDERPLNPQLNDSFLHSSWTTKICLPLRSESHQTRNLFHDVHPSLLLFLHRLRSITIYNQAESRLVTMTRKDLSHNVLEVEHTDGTERWLVVKSTLRPKMLKENVESTELALAFQLNCDNSGSDYIGQPPKQPVFAYLPLRSFGFRFIVQGDFDIPSSREDVDRDSSWNQWLRSEIPQLFLQAMKVFNDHPEFTGLRGLCQFLQFIPLPDEVMDFFKPVAGQIIQLLKGKAFLPTLSSGGQVVYKLPSQVAVCKDAVIRKVISQEELEKHLLLSYLHPGLSPAPPASLLSHLGVRHLRGSAEAINLRIRVHSEFCTEILARLLVCNFRAVEHGYGDGDSILQTLRTLPIIPLADGRVVALDGDGVFFPLEQRHLSALYEDVNIVHPSLMSCMEPLESQQPQELNVGQSNFSEAVVVSYLVFIKQHCISSQEYADIALPVLTNRGLLCPEQSGVHFSEAYGNMDLSKTLPGFDWILLSPKYLEADNDLAGWRQLFSRLGVSDGLIIRKERQTLTPKELNSSPWSVESAMWQQTPGENCVLDDYPCEEFHALATAQLTAPCLLAQRKALLNLLATNWNTGHRYSQYLTAQVLDRDARPIRTTKSSFYHFLCRLKWMPAFRPQEGEKTEMTYLCPNAIYLNAPEINNLLGTHVYYVNMEPSEFTKSLGKNLSCLCGQSIGIGIEGAHFTSTVQHIHNIYSYLHTNCPQSSLKELFQHNPAVFIQLENRSNDWCSGRFYHLREVCWSDPTHMFQRYRTLIRGAENPMEEPKVLAPFYSKLEGMKDFFVRLLNVDGSPNMRQYVAVLEIIASSSPIPTAEVLQDVSVLYATLGKTEGPHSMLDGNYSSTLKGMVSDKRVFPTKDKSWVSLARKPMIADNKELEKIFKPRKEVCLLDLPPAEKKTAPRKNAAIPAFNENDRLAFMNICGIRLLSQCVKMESLTESWRPCAPMQAMVRSLIPHVQKFLYHHEELADIYSELIEDHIAEKIKRLKFAQVGKLYIRYQLDLDDYEDAVVELTDVICLLKDKKELCIQKDHLTAKLDISRELVKMFCAESGHRKELMNFLSGLITSLGDPAALKRFLIKEDIRELPSEEEQWEVPEPPRPEVTLEKSKDQFTAPRLSNCKPHAQFSPPPQIFATGHADEAAVEAALKMWPPPAPPKDSDPEKDVSAKGSDRVGPQKFDNSNTEGEKPFKTTNSRPADQPEPQRTPSQSDAAAAAAATGTTKPPGDTSIKGFLTLDGAKVVMTDHKDLKAIGEWGELLVNSFLCHWRDSTDPGRPTRVFWCNQSGESGQPYDFELTFGPAGEQRGDAAAEEEVLYVEVKSTKKRERSFIVLSANELLFALTRKERYHIFRVYNAGDAQNVRLCRIQNLAQHLHTKKLEIFLFV